MPLHLKEARKPPGQKENVREGKKVEPVVNVKRHALKDLESNKIAAEPKPIKKVTKATVPPSKVEKAVCKDKNETKVETVITKDKAEAKKVATIRQHEQVTSKPQTINIRRKCVEDIDTSDDPLLVREYAKDIYNNLFNDEKKFTIKEHYLLGHSCTANMRSILIDWLVDIHMQFKCTPETLYLTVAVTDRYLQANKTVGRETLQLVGITAFFISSKYEDIYPPVLKDMVQICDYAFKDKQILTMEKDILKCLEFRLTQPISLLFLRRYSRVVKAGFDQHTLAKYLLELVLLQYDMCHIKPSIVAGAALCLSMSILNRLNDPAEAWTENLTYYSTYKYVDIKLTVVNLACALGRAESSKYQAIHKKYAEARYNKISLHFLLKGKLVKKLIAMSPLENQNNKKSLQ